MSRIAGRFRELAEQGRKAVIPYIVAGDPALEVTVGLMHELVAAGATRPEFQPGDGWVVLTDPAGHPFCISAA